MINMHLLRSTSHEWRMIGRNTGDVVESACGGAAILIILKSEQNRLSGSSIQIVCKSPNDHMHSTVSL